MLCPQDVLRPYVAMTRSDHQAGVPSLLWGTCLQGRICVVAIVGTVHCSGIEQGEPRANCIRVYTKENIHKILPSAGKSCTVPGWERRTASSARIGLRKTRWPGGIAWTWVEAFYFSKNKVTWSVIEPRDSLWMPLSHRDFCWRFSDETEKPMLLEQRPRLCKWLPKPWLRSLNALEDGLWQRPGTGDCHLGVLRIVKAVDLDMFKKKTFLRKVHSFSSEFSLQPGTPAPGTLRVVAHPRSWCQGLMVVMVSLVWKSPSFG